MRAQMRDSFPLSENGCAQMAHSPSLLYIVYPPDKVILTPLRALSIRPVPQETTGRGCARALPRHLPTRGCDPLRDGGPMPLGCLPWNRAASTQGTVGQALVCLLGLG